jgi:hypothetical protein
MRGATTLSITTLSITTLSIIVNKMRHSVVAEHCQDTEYHILFNVMLNVIMLRPWRLVEHLYRKKKRSSLFI